MSMPSGAVASYSPAAVAPAAVASGKSSAIYQLGEVLKTLVHHSLAFHDENTTDAAVNAIDKFVGSFVSGSEKAALLTGDERAPREDVAQRVPPGGVPTVVTGPVLDYSKLAAAILEQQQRMQLAQASEPQDTPEG